MTIICGTDFSEGGRPAAVAAGALAKKLADGDLWLVHVLDRAAIDGLSTAAREEAEARAFERLTAEAQRLKERFSLPEVHRVVLQGVASDRLAELAASKEATVLVVASEGHGASPLYRLGGVSERVAAASTVPVLVVREAAPFEAWAEGRRALRVVVGVDWTSSASAAVRWVKKLRAAGSCHVVVTHVYYWGEGSARYGLKPLGSFAEADAPTEALIARDLATRVGDLGGEGPVTYRPKLGFGRLGDHLLEVADSERADLVVVGTHRRRGLRRLASVSSVALHYGRCSVACAPADDVLPDEPRTIGRVLIPTDFSTAANHAVAHGYGLLWSHGGEVQLLHVVEPGRGEPPAPDAEIAAALRALVPPWAASKGIVTHVEVVHASDVARAVSEGAARFGGDVICLASHGRTGLRSVLLGSVAQRVLGEAQQPVLVVRAPPP